MRNFMADYRNANDKLANTYCLTEDGDLVYVNSINGEYADCTIRAFNDNGENGGFDRCDILTEYINPRAIKLGYVNVDTRCRVADCSYLYREPRRVHRQGLDLRNILYNKYGHSIVSSSSTFEANLLGKYPSFRFAVESIVNEEVIGMAFSRHFALLTGLKIEYRGRYVIGTVDKERNSVKLTNKFLFLKESLEESMKNE